MKRTLIYDAVVLATEAGVVVCGIAFDELRDGDWYQTKSVISAWTSHEGIGLIDNDGHESMLLSFESAPGVEHEGLAGLLALAFLGGKQ